MDTGHIRQFGYELGVDAVRLAAIEDYHSEKSPHPGTTLPGVKSLVVLGYESSTER